MLISSNILYILIKKHKLLRCELQNPFYTPLKHMSDLEATAEADYKELLAGENEYDSKHLDKTVVHATDDDVDVADPLDKRNHKINVITPMSLTIAQLVKQRKRKRATFNNLDRMYLASVFDPEKNSDMDDLDTLVAVLESTDAEAAINTTKDEDEDEDEGYETAEDDDTDKDSLYNENEEEEEESTSSQEPAN